MKIRLVQLKVRTKRTSELVPFSPTVTFIHGPVGTGKSTVARLIDYCLGGHVDRTPALQQEFLAAELTALLGRFTVQFERGAQDLDSVRATWSDGDSQQGSVSAPIQAAGSPIYGDEVFSLSDLMFRLCDVQPIKVRKSKLDPESPLVRLSFRDLMWYCYLEQDHLDSSFFRMEDPFKKLKSRDAMRFITGLHSERMNELEIELVRSTEDQRSKREAVVQIRAFMNRFHMGTEIDLLEERRRVQEELQAAITRRDVIDRDQLSDTHALEPLRDRLRELSARIDDAQRSLGDITEKIQENGSLRSELIASKVKARRAEQAGRLLEGVDFERCPQCGSALAGRGVPADVCSLCGSAPRVEATARALELEALRRDLNERIDDLGESLARYGREKERQERLLRDVLERKRALDEELRQELLRYDSAYVATARAADRDVARLQERLASLERLRELPQAIVNLEKQAGSLQGKIDALRSAMADERSRQQVADQRVKQIADRFLEIMRQVKFPGVYPDDSVQLDPRNWLPYIRHGEQSWGFYDAGSGGKKTLFNVCYALAVHTVASEQNLPLPTFLIIDSPTKNISEDENPDLVKALYREIYALAAREGRQMQFVLIDSDLVQPDSDVPQYTHRRMAGATDAPSLISYYEGP